jgi:hypothetical protein
VNDYVGLNVYGVAAGPFQVLKVDAVLGLGVGDDEVATALP